MGKAAAGGKIQPQCPRVETHLKWLRQNWIASQGAKPDE
jgi:hypothetical protein